jgi:hypothetical protein
MAWSSSIAKGQCRLMRMRFSSSAVTCFDHSGFGTMPNMTPPSMAKKPSFSR